MASKRSVGYQRDQAQRATQEATRAAQQARAQAVAHRGAANGNPGLQANLAAQPGQAVVGSVAKPQPPDAQFEQAKLTASRNVALSNSEGAYQEGNLGFDAGYNPDGTVNTANPYSRAALYQLDYENSQRGTTNSMAAAGHLYSGSLRDQRGIDSGNYARNEAGNRLAYQRGLRAIQAGRLGTMAENSLGVGQDDFSALLRATYPGT